MVQNRLTKWETNVPETGKGQRGQHWHWRSPLQNPKAVATARSSDGRAGGISCQTFLNSNSKCIADIIPPPLLSSALHNSVNICFVSAFSASRFSNRSTLNPRSWMPAQLPALLTHKTYTNIHLLFLHSVLISFYTLHSDSDPVSDACRAPSTYSSEVLSTGFGSGEHHLYTMRQVPSFHPPARMVLFRVRKVSFPALLSDLLESRGCKEEKVSAAIKDQSCKQVGAQKYSHNQSSKEGAQGTRRAWIIFFPGRLQVRRDNKK